MSLFNRDLYVDPNGRRYLSEGHYVFSVDNKSISEYYVLNPFWTWFTAKWIPESVAPNAVTFSGFLLMLLTHGLIWYNYPYFTHHESSTSGSSYDYMTGLLSCMIIPVFMFLYQTLDGCDGKQARRTKASSPLGELFDHGVDALCMTILAQSLMSVLGISSVEYPLLCAITHISMWYSFYTAHWEHYHTDFFFMGYIGACDGQLIIIGVYLIGLWNVLMNPAIYPTIAHYYLNNTFNLPYFNNVEISYGLGWILFALVNAITTNGRCIAAVLYHYWFSGKKDETPNKRNSFLGSMLDLLPLTIMSITWFTWAVLFNHHWSAPLTETPRSIVGHPVGEMKTLWQRDAMWFVTTGGLAFGMYLTTINISRVTRQPFQYLSFQNVFTVGIMLIQVVNSMVRMTIGSPIVEEALLLRISCIVTLLVYVDFVSNVATNFSKAMNIFVFKLGKRNPNLKKD